MPGYSAAVSSFKGNEGSTMRRGNRIKKNLQATMAVTTGAIMRIHAQSDTSGNPVVQIIDLRPIGSSTGNAAQTRYRLVISDGTHYQQAMLATQLNTLVESKQLNKHSLVQLQEFICNVVANRRIVIILNLTVKNPDFGSVIGNPVNVETAVAGSSGGASAASPVKPAPQTSKPAVQSSYGAAMSGPVLRGGYGGGDATPTFDSSAIRSISSLNPYQNHWVIKARVTAKGQMRTWNNARGEGKLFSVDLLDADGGEIRATMFNDAADKFFPVFEQGKVYMISRGQLKIANKKFSRLPNDYEITLNSDAQVAPAAEDGHIKNVHFSFRKIADISDCEENSNIDVIGVVTNVDDIRTIVSKRTSREIPKRELTLVDDSNTMVNLTLWGDDANNYNDTTLANNPILAVKSARVSDFGGKSLSSSFNSTIHLNPDDPRAAELKSWWDRQGSTSTGAQSISDKRTSSAPSPRRSLSDVKDMNLGLSEKGDFFVVMGTVTFIRHDKERKPWYQACPTPKCNKKVTEVGPNQYHCENCNQAFGECQNRYILSVMLADSTASQWVTMFNDLGEQLLGRKADELARLLQSPEGELEYERAFKSANFTRRLFKIRAKMDHYNDQQRLKCTALSADPINYKNEAAMNEIDFVARRHIFNLHRFVVVTMVPVSMLSSVLFWTLFVELFLALLLIVPVGNNLKQSAVEWAERSHWLAPGKYVLVSLFAVVAFLFVDFTLTVWKYREMDSNSSEQRVLFAHNLLQAERDRYLAGFVLVLLLLLWRLYSMLKRINRLEKKHHAMEKQAKSASEHCHVLMDKNEKLEARLESAIKGGLPASVNKKSDSAAVNSDKIAASVAKLESSLAEEKAVRRRADERSEALEKRVTELEAELDTERSEHQRTQEKLEDFNLMFEDSLKKEL